MATEALVRRGILESIANLFRKPEPIAPAVVEVVVELEVVSVREKSPIQAWIEEKPGENRQNPFAWRRRIEMISQSGNIVRTKKGQFEIDANGKAFGKTVYELTKDDLK